MFSFSTITQGGHIIIFSTRVEQGSFASQSPSLVFFSAVIGTQVCLFFFLCGMDFSRRTNYFILGFLTQIIATVFAVYGTSLACAESIYAILSAPPAPLSSVAGVFMSAIGWKWAGVIWAYCIGTLLVADLLKQVILLFFSPLSFQLELSRASFFFAFV